MHLLVISLLTILAGVLLLIKTQKEQLGKFFTYISWFFVVVGFLLFAGFIAGAVHRLSHPFPPVRPWHQRGIMMRKAPMRMEKSRNYQFNKEKCKMMDENCMKMGCAGQDSLKKCCPGHAPADSVAQP